MMHRVQCPRHWHTFFWTSLLSVSFAAHQSAWAQDYEVCTPAFRLETTEVPTGGVQVSGNTGLEVIPQEIPITVEADQVSAEADQAVTAQGNVVITRGRLTVKSEEMHLDSNRNLSSPSTMVANLDAQHQVTGTQFTLNLDSMAGTLTAPDFLLARRSSSKGAEAPFIFAQGSRAQLDGRNIYRVYDVRLSTCENKPWRWSLHASQIKFDYEKNRMSAYNPVLYIGKIPIFYFPYINASLDNERKSGLLLPSYSQNSLTGLEIELPLYLNLRPNMDATATARYLSRRGTEGQFEWRYLMPNYSGLWTYTNLPNDHATDLIDRSSYEISHRQQLLSRLTMDIYANRISDDFVYRDLVVDSQYTARVNLPKRLDLNYEQSWWNARVRAQSFQTLDQSVPVNPLPSPYKSLPQIDLWASRDLKSFGTVNIPVQFGHFTQNDAAPMINRFVLAPTWYRPIDMNGLTITPRITGHYTHYSIDQKNVDSRSADRFIPIYRLDAAMSFQRETRIFSTNWFQTLEPRVSWLRVPYQDQSTLPIIDTGLADQSSLSDFFRDNIFSGEDRIANTHQIMAGATTSLLNPATGERKLWGSAGQIYYLQSRKVPLYSTIGATGDPAISDNSRSNLFIDVNGALSNSITMSASWLYDPVHGRQTSLATSLGYVRSPGHVVNLSYQDTDVYADRIAEIAGQWYLGKGWYLAAKERYSLARKKRIQDLIGLEYNPGCLLLRIAAQSLVTGPNSSVSSIFFQVGFVGLGNLTFGKTDLLPSNINNYSDPQSLPSREQLEGKSRIPYTPTPKTP